MNPRDKKVLKAISLELRHLLEGYYDSDGKWQPGDLEQRLAAIGVRRDREPVPVDELAHLSDDDKNARTVVDAYLQLRDEAGLSREEAVAEFVRETAYTWANRLFCLRCMEARELIDEVIAIGNEPALAPARLTARLAGAPVGFCYPPSPPSGVPIMKRNRLLWACLPVFAGALLAATLHADEAHPKGPHLRYVTSYADAMLEARIRGVPIFFARHKDF